jgi:hypothetical protein
MADTVGKKKTKLVLSIKSLFKTQESKKIHDKTVKWRLLSVAFCCLYLKKIISVIY